MKNFSALGKPKFLSSKKSQCKNKNTKNTPPATSNIGAEASIELFTSGLPDQVAMKACQGPKLGLKAQTIAHGKIPRTTNTAKSIPQKRNHLRARAPMVPNTSA